MSGARPAAWTVALAVAVGALVALGRGVLAAPPLLHPGALGDWVRHRDAVVAAGAVVRLLALAAAGYLLAVTVLGLVARGSGRPTLARVSRAVTLPAVQHLLGAVAGVGLTASTAALIAQAGGARAPSASTSTVLTRLPDGAGPVLARLPDDAGPTLERLPDGGDTDIAPGPPAPDRPTEDGTGTDEWVVAPGDHLWHIAEATLAEAWGRAPTDDEVAPFWARVVEVNRARLVDPDDPDLIHPGQRMRVPPAPSPGPGASGQPQV